MNKLGILIVFLATLMLQGCDFFRKHPNETVVAECYGKYLFVSDLQGLVPEGASVMDSIFRVNAFIDSWIQRQVLLHQAESNLSKEDLDLAKQLEEYRNSLIVYKYETQLISQKLDTVVSEEEIEAYYEDNKDSFQLRTTMVKVAYVILDEDCKQKDMFQKLMSDRDTLLLHNLDVLATYYAVSSYLDVDHWIRLDELTNTVPIEIYNVESFLKKNRFVRFDWDNYICMMRFEDYLLEESLSPLDLVQDDIREVILTRRKKELIDRMKAAVYEKALKNKDFQVYVGVPSLDNSNNNE